jgi:acyl-coenzyme A synthetase/AMP-(fatty) acid ligase
VHRIAALAVAPGLDEHAILDALRLAIDPLFLPRPLRLVAALPRNETGKLPRAALIALLNLHA